MGVLAAVVPDVEHAGVLEGRTCLDGRCLEGAGCRVNDLDEVGDGEVFADDGAPPVCSEMNLRHDDAFR